MIRFAKDSVDYQVNWEIFHEMEECVPMTKPERDALLKQVKKGFDIDDNPWGLTQPDGYPMNYLQAYRIQYGYSSGPWDDWKGPEDQLFWDNCRKSFFTRDELEL